MNDTDEESDVVQSVKRWPSLDEFAHQRCKGHGGEPEDFTLIRYRPGQRFSQLYALLPNDLARVLGLDDYLRFSTVEKPPDGLDGDFLLVNWETGMDDNVYVWDREHQAVIRKTGSIPDGERIAAEAASHSEYDCDHRELEVVVRGSSEYDPASDKQFQEAR